LAGRRVEPRRPGAGGRPLVRGGPGRPAPRAEEPKKEGPGWFDKITDVVGDKVGTELESLGRKFSREIAEVEDLAVGTLTGVLKQMVTQAVPALVGQFMGDQMAQAANCPTPGTAGESAGTTASAGKPKGNGRHQFVG